KEVCTSYLCSVPDGGTNWSGKISTYRYHILDPIMFDRSIKVTIEHGHNNHRSDDVSSTAYWYQSEPHQPFPALPKIEGRLPLPDLKPMNPVTLSRIFGHQNP
ncbi:DUF2961 domain-containing protein, partial [Cohnella sp. GbtcB17]|uniref:DUF2961 domain-containing protein n=1 Tax=Cohnella sp. GbtcB17 TaxID=2824762 RepID=UPI001C3022DB